MEMDTPYDGDPQTPGVGDGHTGGIFGEGDTPFAGEIPAPGLSGDMNGTGIRWSPFKTDC